MLTIPYFPPYIHKLFGPFQVSSFGICLIIAMIFGSWMIQKRGKQLLLEKEDLNQLIFLSLISGFLGAHIVNAIFYSNMTHKSTLEFLKALIDVRQGLSSTGGMMSAVIAGVIFCAVKKTPILAMADAMTFGFTGGWIIARLGCFSVHDHPGVLLSSHDTSHTLTRFLMKFSIGVQYSPNSTNIRHDLGLYEAIATAVLFGVFLAVYRFKSKVRAGFYVALALTFYGPVRFILDFLRATDLAVSDQRHALGLTFAQYACIGMTLLGMILWARIYISAVSPRRNEDNQSQ